MIGDDLPQGEIDRLLRAIEAAKRGPRATELAEAPELDRWLPLLRRDGTPLLAGHVRGHPLLGAREIFT